MRLLVASRIEFCVLFLLVLFLGEM